MIEQINITLNGKKIQVPGDKTILEIAGMQGIDIPTFCSEHRLKPFASCFVCVVEVEKSEKLLPACSTQVQPGMVIFTNSEKVISTRKMALDLLLSDHAGDCIAPCQEACPAHTDVQGYVAHIANGDFEAAVRLIKEHLPLPIVCGIICPNPCEYQCRRGLVDEPIAIRSVKRMAARYDLQYGPFLPPTSEDTGRKVVIIGGGPAGLAAAYFLRQMGHEVHIYEALSALGGMTRYGIPRFRLPWDELDSEIRSIIDLGVKVHTNMKLGRDFSLEDVKKGGADAILLAIGAHKSKPMRVKNENTPGVIGGVDFLRGVVLGERIHTGKNVAVIGGGDVAMDCARVARRLNARVTILYRRTQKEMPALVHERVETKEEGVRFRYLTAPLEVISEDGRAKALKVQKMELGEPDDSGRRRPVPIPGSEETLEFDLIISAIGQEADLSCLENVDEALKPETTRWNTIVYDSKNMTTSIPGVFTAGDCAFGPDTVVHALGEGRIAAQAIHLYLNDAKIEFRKEYTISRGRIEELKSEDFAPRFAHKKREREITHPSEKRLANGGYAPINTPLTDIQAVAECSRCIECGCMARFDCKLRDYSTEYGATEKNLAGKKREYEKDKRHPLIQLETDKCITCANCIRVCSEVRKISALTLVERGFTTHPAPNFEDPLQSTDCDACGMCIDICPTGAIAQNTGKEFGPWPANKTISACISCGRGCTLEIFSAEGEIIRTKSVAKSPINNGILCAEGRFSYQLLNTVDDDFLLYSEKVEKAVIEKIVAAKKIAIILSPWMTIEDHFSSWKFAGAKKATLYYCPDNSKEDEKFPHSKLQGRANLALLHRLGVEPWQTKLKKDFDCIIAIQAFVAEMVPENKLIAISSYPAAKKVLHQLPLADPLESIGLFLNIDGKLSILNSYVEGKNPLLGEVLAKLSNIPELADISFLREELSKKVPELSNITAENNNLLIDTDLEPEISTVALDCRGIAFSKYLKKLELNWP
ncbi:FAD-dependent oxidoreductase [Candidatus Riflebacteria bacterium]